MARICYTADQEVANKGLLRISIIAKLLKMAPKTVNAWTKYQITKIRGVKYLSWEEVRNDRLKEAELLNLSVSASDAWMTTQGLSVAKDSSIQDANSALTKAKALLAKKNIVVKELPIAIPVEDEILTVNLEVDDVLTIKPEYKHMLLRK